MGLLGWAVTFLIVSLIAGVLGFSQLSGVAASIAKILFAIFVILFVFFILSAIGLIKWLTPG